MSEVVNPGGHRDPSGPRDPSLRDTALPPIDERMALRLSAKLTEYRKRWSDLFATLATVHPDAIAATHGYKAYGYLFRTHLLEGFLQTNTDHERDFYSEPVTVVETALDVTQRTGVDVTAAAMVPFVYDSAWGVHIPDETELRAVARDSHHEQVLRQFFDAHCLIRDYAGNNPAAMIGGTGLPELPDETAPNN